jgi:hypothetical protein
MPCLWLTLTYLPLSSPPIFFGSLILTTWGMIAWTRPSGSSVIVPSALKLTVTDALSTSTRPSKSPSVDSRIKCSRRMWRGACALVDWRRPELWCVFRVRCRTIGKRSICLRGRWNVGVCPEKGMMLRLRRKYLVSAVMTTRAESRISHGLLVVRSWLTDQSADVVLVSIVLVITCTYDD